MLMSIVYPTQFLSTSSWVRNYLFCVHVCAWGSECSHRPGTRGQKLLYSWYRCAREHPVGAREGEVLWSCQVGKGTWEPENCVSGRGKPGGGGCWWIQEISDMCWNPNGIWWFIQMYMCWCVQGGFCQQMEWNCASRNSFVHFSAPGKPGIQGQLQASTCVWTQLLQGSTLRICVYKFLL